MYHWIWFTSILFRFYSIYVHWGFEKFMLSFTKFCNNRKILTCQEGFTTILSHSTLQSYLGSISIINFFELKSIHHWIYLMYSILRCNKYWLKLIVHYCVCVYNEVLRFSFFFHFLKISRWVYVLFSFFFFWNRVGVY